MALIPEGFEEREVAGSLELIAYTDEAGEARVRSAFEATSAEDVEPGWAEAWRHFHRPVRVGPLWVGPPWEEPDADAVPIVIDPGLAFGTGAHASTRLCLELLLELERGGLVDLGCGSGVLAIAAAKLGFEPVVALDRDAAAVAATEANARANGVVVLVRQADVLAEPLPVCELGLANIELAAVARVASRFRGRLLVVSGFLAAEAPTVPGRRRVERRERDGWAAELLERLYD